MRSASLPLLSAVITMFACGAEAAHAADCAGLKAMSLPGTTITSAAVVEAGAVVTLPYGGGVGKLPAFCRVEGVLRPTADSEIHFEVWMPETGWNGRFVGTGNGGFGGSVYYGQMAANVRNGFATGGVDAGHQAEAEDASWAYKHPEKVKDFGWRALHLETERAKQIVSERYGKAATKSYFDGCSDGGREALMEAQRFPEDYDGILAGAPANAWTNLITGGLALGKVVDGDPAGFISAFKLPAITRAVLAQCDAKDGLKDGILTDPRSCHFDPKTIECRDGKDGLDCLTAPQVRSLEAIYAGGKTAGGRVIAPGLMPGDEAGGWKGWVVQSSPAPSAYAQGFFRYMVYEDPTWNSLTADVDQALKDAKAKTGEALDAVNPDLSAFAARGGKLMLYHGWNDPAISPLGTIGYYEQVRKTMGEAKADGAVRLYLVSGMAHCAGGPGPSAFGQLTLPAPEGAGALGALETWVEDGKAPGTLVAAKYGADGTVERTRPVCAYPAEWRYDGTGDPDVAASFACK